MEDQTIRTLGDQKIRRSGEVNVKAGGNGTWCIGEMW